MNTKTRGNVDGVFLFLLILLTSFGLAALFSAGGPVGYAKFGDAYFFIKRQLIYGLIPGILAIIVLLKLDLQYLRKMSWFIYIISLILLVMVFIPGIGVTINSSRSWLNVFGFNFQPAELSKFAIVIISAYILSKKKYDWDDWQSSLLPVLGILSPTVLLILAQPDVGTLSIIGVIIFAMLFVAKVPGKYLVTLGLIGIVSLVILILIAPYRLERITTFLHPELDPKGQGYQMNQAFLAVGSGGFWGLGFGQSRQKFQYLPEVSADTIFAVIAEENGFLVAGGLVMLILFIAWRGFKIAKGCHDQFQSLLVTGVMVWFCWQSFLNIGATVGVLPLTGVPLPLISHGGSAFAVMLAASGLVLKISKESNL